MSKINQLFYIICFIVVSNLALAQNHTWITPNKTYLKMYLAEDAMYRINRSDFTNNGINTTGLDPRTVKVLYKGNQIPIYFSGEQDGVFNDNDYFDFYGQRNYGGPTPTYTESNVVFYTTNEYYNIYSDTSNYWVDWGGANGVRYTNYSYSTSSLYPIDYFYNTYHFEKDKIYSQGEHVSNNDFRFLSNEKFKGEGWYWTLLLPLQSLSDTFSVPDVSNSGASSSFRIFAYPDAQNTSILNEHGIEIMINGNIIDTLFTNDYKRIDTTINFPTAILSGSTVNNINLRYLVASGFAGRMFIDMFEIKYPHLFRLRNKMLAADLNSADTTSKLFRISSYSSANTINVYDVKNNLRITSFSSNLDTLKFTGRSSGKFEIVNDTIRRKPFRIKQRQVPDLVSNSNGVDYLVLYNGLFVAQAEQLRAYRETHDGFRSFKAEIEAIYDIFNFGIEHPDAVRNFVIHVYNTWQLPRVKYLCLFGRSSLDPKKNSTASTYYQNLVPTYGNPNSDSYFSNINIGTFFYYNQIAIGRLPAYSVSEAQSIVDKIIGYEAQSPELWSKGFSYITGGATLADQQSFQQRSNFEITQYIVPPPICGNGHKIYRSDTLGSVTFDYADSIKNDLNRGTLFVNFRGHAGSHDWEVGMSDPAVLNNGFKLPLVLSLTCFTGENSNSFFRGFGEKFLYYADKGAIGFVGTTGWSFKFQGDDFGTFIIQSMKLDTNRRIGDLVKVANKSMSSDSTSFNTRHTINCYGLIGDPAAKLNLPRIPEFVITENDFALPSESILLKEEVALKIFPKNFGLFADSCKIRFQIKRYNQNFSVKDTVYKAFRYLDTVIHRFRIDSPGVYTMIVNLDQDNWYPLENNSNNSVVFNIPLTTNLFAPISPIDNSIVYKDSVEFSGLNPVVDFSQKSVRVILQMDTTKSFTSPISRTFVNINISGVVTKFRTNVPVLNNNTLYYWRMNSTINNDSAGWSRIQTFIYNNGAAIRSSEEDRFTFSHSPVVLRKIKPQQYSQSDFTNTSYSQDGIKLTEDSINLFVRSYGSNGEEASYFSVGDANVFIDGGSINAGLNMLKVRKVNGKIIERKNLKMTFASSSDSLVTFLNTFDSTYFLMLLNASYVAGGTNLSTSAKEKLRQFGSIYCDSIGLLGYFHTWSLIGWHGASHSQVSEMFDPCCRPAPNCVACDGHWIQSISSMDVVVKKTNGTVSHLIGPAQTWSSFSWTQDVAPNSTLKFDVIGINQSGQQTVLLQNLQTNNFTDISNINSYQYPRLNLVAKFDIDTLAGRDSPLLKSIQVDYSPATELVLDKNSLQITTDSKRSGTVNYSFNYHNAGYSYIYGIIINTFNKGDTNVIATDTVSTLLKMDSLLNYSHSLDVPQREGISNILISIKPKGAYNEFHTYNNLVTFEANTVSSIAAPIVEVFGDGKKINSGDYMRKNPEIKINLSNSGSMSLASDTSRLSVKLNDIYVPYFIRGSMNSKFRIMDNDNLKTNSQSLVYYPELMNGKNQLSIIYKSDSEQSDTANYDVFVSEELLVMDIYNYPNPMKDETNFIFNLAGSVRPELFKIKIYTVRGRLIREVITSVNIGSNQIPWDGRDSDGDFVANGTYFYKLITEDESKIETQIQKLVVLR